MGEESDLFGQHVIIAQAKADVAMLSIDDVMSVARETLPPYMIPEAIGIIDRSLFQEMEKSTEPSSNGCHCLVERNQKSQSLEIGAIAIATIWNRA